LVERRKTRLFRVSHLEALDSIAGDTSSTPARFAIAWLIAQPATPLCWSRPTVDSEAGATSRFGSRPDLKPDLCATPRLP